MTRPLFHPCALQGDLWYRIESLADGIVDAVASVFTAITAVFLCTVCANASGERLIRCNWPTLVRAMKSIRDGDADFATGAGAAQ